MIETRSNVNTHGPNFVILWITIRVDFRVGITSSIRAVISSTRGSTATRPIYTSHVKVDVICNFYVWILFLDPFIGPKITTAFSTFFSRPQTEDHGISSTVASHRLCYSEHHARSGSVVISTNASSICSAKDVWVECDSVHRWCNIKMCTEHHPLIGIHFAPTIPTDVVGFWILRSRHDRIVDKSLRDDFKTKILQGLDEMQSSILVSSITLSSPTIEITKSTIDNIGWICSLVAQT